MTLHYTITAQNTIEVRDQDDHLRGVITPGGNTLLLTLDEGDTATNPASTKTRICGPCKLDYTFHADGGIDASVDQEVSV